MYFMLTVVLVSRCLVLLYCYTNNCPLETIKLLCRYCVYWVLVVFGGDGCSETAERCVGLRLCILGSTLKSHTVGCVVDPAIFLYETAAPSKVANLHCQRTNDNMQVYMSLVRLTRLSYQRLNVPLSDLWSGVITIVFKNDYTVYMFIFTQIRLCSLHQEYISQWPLEFLTSGF